ncbi:MAG TPA: ABC transporter ATP-binding protein [Chloroflexota bacterium]|nr:ABC transporter ATP-binding protein [Chloroflexota bacterium]
MALETEQAQRAPRQEGTPLLQVKDLHTNFQTMDGVVKAVDGVSFDIQPGASVGIVGESGSGKSVTSLSIMRLVERPGWIPSGSIIFQGKDLLKLDDEQMRRIRGEDIAMVFQEPMSALNPVYTVGDQVAEIVRAHHRVGKRAAWARAVELFKLVGIPAADRRVHDYPHNLSGGMRQRVMIAMALANDPDLLILDEPTTALDVTIQAQILDLVRNLRERVNTAVLLITHDIGVVAEMCDEIIVMYGGKIMEHGTTHQIIDDPKHPYTRGLLAAIPAMGMKGQRLTVIPGTVPSPLRMPSGCPFRTRCPNVMDVCSNYPTLKTLDDGRQVYCWLYER